MYSDNLRWNRHSLPFQLIHVDCKNVSLVLFLVFLLLKFTQVIRTPYKSKYILEENFPFRLTRHRWPHSRRRRTSNSFVIFQSTWRFRMWYRRIKIDLWNFTFYPNRVTVTTLYMLSVWSETFPEKRWTECILQRQTFAKR